jgi:non-lysosomal glucosylceramidase
MDSDTERPQPCCSSSSCRDANRREFLKLCGLGTTAALAAGLPAMAGPFEAADFEKLIPADKKLDAAWLASLTARGEPSVYRGTELEKIGMPVGGICAGQLYLGGDGRLWHWDIFNQTIGTGAEHYANPMRPDAPLDQGFALRITAGGKTQARRLDGSGFADVDFLGQYPIARVRYRDPGSPVTAVLEAFSPFVPLEAEDSSLPVTVMRFTLKNTGAERAEVQLAGWLENAVCRYSGKPGMGNRRNAAVRERRLLMIQSSAAALEVNAPRPDVVFDDFQKATYEGWEVQGKAFGTGPILKSQIPSYQGDVGGSGPRVVNSHATAPGNSVEEKDRHTGRLTSREFEISRNFIAFEIGGGRQPGKTGLHLLVDGKVVRAATGQDNNRMRSDSFDVRDLAGKTARLEIVDEGTGPWGNIGVGRIVQTDRVSGPLTDQPDFGTMTLALLEPAAADRAVAAVPAGPLPDALFEKDFLGGEVPASASAAMGEKLAGALVRSCSLEPGQETTATFLIAWHFPNLRLKDGGRFYANRFASAAAVAAYTAENFDRLATQTRLWRDTWYDSTLPYWFLDRTLLNVSILATSTAHWFKSGRFYGWEGVGCCEGTCTHVWHYAHAVARLFPQLERDLRRRTDFDRAMDPRSGVINHRGESQGLAVDGQAGCILRAYREHQMSTDDAFLRGLWPKIKLAMECLVRMDPGDGLVQGAQHNTLDQPWFGKVAWLSSLYVAAARACEEMAKELGDEAYARRMRQIVERGGQAIDRELFNGEYYYHLPDEQHKRSVGSHNGCEIDQVFGQSWAWQVGLGRILPEAHVKTALRSLWRYNFTPDVGPFRRAHKPGRWYAMAGEGGLIMCTWPKGAEARVQEGFDFYFNECMTGFEYQVSGHMIWEGLLTEGLAVARAIHDRYQPMRRNPWNEVECGDHYARAMASYGVFLAACGYEYHGPKGHLGFAPRLAPEDFRAAFTTAEGWGAFSQNREGQVQRETIEVRRGRLRLRTLAFALAENAKPKKVDVLAGGKPVAVTHVLEGNRVLITLAADAELLAGQKIEVVIG